MFRTLGRVLQRVQIYVSNLPLEAKDSDLKPVLPDNAKIVMKKHFCFINIDEKDDPEKIINDLNTLTLQSRKVYAKLNDRNFPSTQNKMTSEPRTEAKTSSIQEIITSKTNQDTENPESTEIENPKFTFIKETKNQRENFFSPKHKTNPYFNNRDDKDIQNNEFEAKKDFQNNGKTQTKFTDSWKINSEYKKPANKVSDQKNLTQVEKDRIYLNFSLPDFDDFDETVDIIENFDDLDLFVDSVKITDIEDEDEDEGLDLAEFKDNNEDEEKQDQVKYGQRDEININARDEKYKKDDNFVMPVLFGQVAKAEKVEKTEKVEMLENDEDLDYLEDINMEEMGIFYQDEYDDEETKTIRYDHEAYFLLPKYFDPSDYEETFTIRADFSDSDRIKLKKF